jgi:hypothetical protein
LLIYKLHENQWTCHCKNQYQSSDGHPLIVRWDSNQASAQRLLMEQHDRRLVKKMTWLW